VDSLNNEKQPSNGSDRLDAAEMQLSFRESASRSQYPLFVSNLPRFHYQLDLPLPNSAKPRCQLFPSFMILAIVN
jgi:hypothetical protein